jgi:hypothetical protein
VVNVTFTCIDGQCDEPVHFDTFEYKAYQTDQIALFLTVVGEEGAKYATVETSEGGLLGVKLPNGQIFAFNPN